MNVSPEAGEKKLSGLRTIPRADGTVYYCFSEVKAKVFSNVAPGTLKSWVRYLRINKPKCTYEEHNYFKTLIPDIAKGAFKLISLEDVLKLISYCDSRETQSSPKAKRPKVPSDDGSTTAAAFSPIASPTSDSNIQVDRENSGDPKSRDSLNSLASIQNRISRDAEGEVRVCEIAESVVLRESPSTSVSVGAVVIKDAPSISLVSSDTCGGEESADNEVLTETPFKFKSRRSRKLSLADLDESVKAEMESLKSFYRRPLNTQRSGPFLQAVSMDKIIERLLVYLKYVKGFRANVSMNDVEDGELVEGFCNYLRSKERNLQSITVSRYISALISVVRFLHREKSSVAQENLPALSRLRALQSQLEFDARKERKPTQRKSILYEEILQIVRDLLHEFEDASCGVDKARALMNFCILLLYTHVTGRCKEFVTLKVIDCESTANLKEGNFLVHQRDSLVLLCNDFKTQRIYGPDRTVLHDPHLEYYIRLYINSYRSKLLEGNVHNYFLVNYHAQPFSVTSFNKYVGELFEKHCSFRLSINDLRHSIVSYFLSLPEENNSSQLVESLASVMKHTVRTQRRFYDDRTLEAKKAPALTFLSRKANSTIFGEENDEEFDSENEEGYVDARPAPNDIIALVASNSTTSSPQILLAKILRFTANKTEALLAHFEEVSENHFKMIAGRSYIEPTTSLIYPVDLIYRPEERVYELRSDKLELHRQTRQ